MPKKRLKVLLLGATGRIGPGLLEEYSKNYRKYYDIIIGSRKKLKIDFKIVKIDLGNVNILKKAMKGIDVVVNLAANSNQNASFSELLEPNIIGAYNVFQAAKDSKVKRVVFASSVHAIKGYPHGYKVGHNDTPKPLDFYGASKAYGEALCSVFSNRYNLSCLAIRIGAYVSNNQKKIICYTKKDYDYVITQRDLAQLIHKCIIAPKSVCYGILSGISNDAHKRMELNFTKNLIGYNPKDDAFKDCRVIKKSGLK